MMKNITERYFFIDFSIKLIKILPRGVILMKTIGEEVKANRKRMGLTQIELARYANVSPKFVIELENNKKTIQLDKLLDVLNVFDLTLSVKSKERE